MSIDIKKAFNFPFKDEFWSYKLLVGGAIFFIIAAIQMLGGFLEGVVNIAVNQYGFNSAGTAIIIQKFVNLMIFLLSLVILAIPVGYTLQSAHNEIKSEEPLLPSWDNKFYDYFIYGLYFYAVKILYFFGLLFISAIPIGISTILFGIYGPNQILSIISIFFILAFMAPFVLFYAFIMPFIFTAYAENFNFTDAFRLNKILGRMSDVLPDYLIALGLSFMISFVLPILSVLLTCTCVGLLFLPFFVLPILLIGTNLFAQAYKKSIYTGESS